MRQHEVEKKPAPPITTEELLRLREKLHMSRTVFARYLRTNERALQNWEHGRASPNAQAAVLIRMVELYPDTVGGFPQSDSNYFYCTIPPNFGSKRPLCDVRGCNLE